MNDYAVALLVFTPLILVWGVVSLLRLQAKPASNAWVLSGYAVLAIVLAEWLCFVSPLISTIGAPVGGGLLGPDLVLLWVTALVYLAVLLPAGYAIAAQRWGLRDHGLSLGVAFTAVLILFALSALYQVGVMR